MLGPPPPPPPPPAAKQMCKPSDKLYTECPRAKPGYHGDGWARAARGSAVCEQEAGSGWGVHTPTVSRKYKVLLPVRNIGILL